MPDFFKQFPYTPPTAPEQDYQVTNKKYVDDAIDTDIAAIQSTELIAPSSVTLTAGTSSDGVSDLQTVGDGNTYDVAEVGATPGFDLKVNFANIARVDFVYIMGFYDEAAAILGHTVAIQLYNTDTSTYDTIGYIPEGNGIGPNVFLVDDSSAYYAGSSIVRFNHTSAGNATHDLYLDYVAIKGLTT